MSEQGNGRLDRISTAAFLNALGGEYTQGKIVAALEANPGKFVPREDLIEVIWGDREDGGPLTANKSLDVFLWRIRNAGCQIEARWGMGFRLIQIEDDIPVPGSSGRESEVSRELIDALRALRPKQSFFEARGETSSMRSKIMALARKTKVPIMTRSVIEDGKPGIRVWRLER